MSALAVASLLQPASSADGDSSNMSVTGRLFHGLPQRITLSGSLAYVALDSGLEIVDLADAARPKTLGSLHLTGSVSDAAIEGALVAIAAGEAGIVLVDSANPAAPVLLGRHATLAPARAVSLQAGVLVVAGGGTGRIETFDVSDPTAPRPLGSTELPAPATSIARDGSLVLVGLAGAPGLAGGIVACDIQDPSLPRLIAGSLLALELPVNQIRLELGRALLAIGSHSLGALVVADVVSPSTPVLIGRLPLANAALDLAVDGGLAFVATRELGIKVVDVSDPGRLAAIGGTALGDYTVTAALRDGLLVAGQRSFSGSSGIVTLDTQVPVQPRRIARLAYAEATGVSASLGFAYLLERDGLHVFDMWNPTSPARLSTWSLAGADYHSLAVEGRLAAVAEGQTLHLVDLSDSLAPREVSRIELPGVIVRPVLHGGFLHVLTAQGIDTWDVIDPMRPAGLGGLRTFGMPSALAIVQGRGYLAVQDEILVLDLAGGAPRGVGSIVLPGEWLMGAAAEGSTLVATGLSHSLWVLDISSPTAPVVTASVAGEGRSVQLSDGRAVIAAGQDGVRVFDLADPANPAEIAFYDASGEVTEVSASGSTIYATGSATQHWVLFCGPCAARAQGLASITGSSSGTLGTGVSTTAAFPGAASTFIRSNP